MAFRRDGTFVMVRSVDARLEQTEEAFYRVRGDAPSIFVSDVFIRPVVHLVVIAIRQRTMESRRGIRHHVRIFCDHLFDDGL